MAHDTNPRRAARPSPSPSLPEPDLPPLGPDPFLARTPRGGSPETPPVRQPEPHSPRRVREADPLTIRVDTAPHPPSIVTKEDREKARNILDEIGKRFAANRKKGKSTAYEIYQADLAENFQYLVAGGLMSVKEMSEMFMRTEEFRKATNEHGETPASLLAKWLRGENVAGL